jgi:Skp family chaperone for outer membrane proteins
VRLWKTFAITFVLAAASAVPTLSQAQAPKGSGTTIGVVDIGYVFFNHPTMKAQVEKVDAEIRAEEDSINQQREAIIKEVEKLRLSMKEDTPQYKEQEEKIAKAESELKLEFMRKEKKFAQDKAQILRDTYKDIQDKVTQIALTNSVAVVLRYTKDEMDVTKPASVSAGIARDLVYFNPTCDMTPLVLQMLGVTNPQPVTAAGAEPVRSAAQPAQQGRQQLR